ncbi:MAG: hypothetical protein DI551_00765 [Micavibrio aeruginosavorus]|uniref:Uncharacterized protein n=1 Tax=Micavibrio aeruginosavorus TaxID=349221 RepID=A0A2W5NDS5_9BACT|nr:MAG: hypothetical protein DI551_00765 [Micavibrio aeruginosavorus]
MANRTGQQYEYTKLRRGTPQTDGAPRVQYATTSANGATGEGVRTLAGVLAEITTRVEDRLDIQAKIDGARAGAIAGGRDGLPEREDDATIRGAAFNMAARDAVSVRSEMEGVQALDDFEQDHQADPLAFRKNADDYLNAKLPRLKEYDPALGQRLEADLQLRAKSAENRIKDRQISIIRDQQLEWAMKHQLKLQDDMASDAADLLDAGPQEAQQILTRMMSSTAKLVDTANHIGPDGRPLFGARERAMAGRQAEAMVSEKIGLAWMRKQPDMLSAWKDWQGGKATLQLAGDDGVVQTMNLKEVLGPSGYQAAGEAFMDNIRSELALRNQVDAAQDRQFKDISDQTFADLSVRAQEGGLTLSQVEEKRQTLEPDRYLTLRQLAKKGGASVSDGKIYSDLAVQDAEGQDIRPRLRSALDAGTISRDDYLQLYERNVGRMNRGSKDAVTTGRDYLTQGLGSLSKEIGMAQSSTIGQANTEYEIEIQSFKDKEGREPTHVEARDIAENVRSRYSVINVQDNIFSMPLPRSMTQSEKLSKSLNSAVIEGKIRTTNKEYLAKHNGNAALRDSDPEYIHEIRLLQDYHSLLKIKETENAERSSGAK